MSRIHEDRKEFYNREGILTSSPNLRNNIVSQSQGMDKEKNEKSLYGQSSYVGDTGFRTVDLIKQQGRNIVPSSLSVSATQLHAMPHLVTNYMTVPLSQTRHAFQAHIPVPVGIRAATAIAPPRASVTAQRLPALKPTNLANQIQLPLAPISSLPILPPSVATNNHTGSPTVTTHGLTSDSRLDSRTHDPHNTIRGNVQATSHNTTIQVIASGSQVHIPTPLLNTKNPVFNSQTPPNMLKIGVSTHGNSSSALPPAAGLKLGIGKTYPSGSSSVIIPSSKTEDHRASSFTRYTSQHNVTISTHQIQGLAVATPISNSKNVVATTPTTSSDARSHVNMSIPYQPAAAAFVFHDIGAPLGLHNFSHQIARPSTTATTALPLFTVDSSHSLPTVPVVSIAVTKGHILTTEALSNTSKNAESLTIHNANNFNIQNLYPNLQTSNIATPFAVVTTSVEPSARPSILRKRHAEGPTMFPVLPTEKERISSPMKNDRTVFSNRILSPLSLSEKPDPTKPINHSIQSITAEVKNLTQSTLTPMSTTAEKTSPASTLSTAQPISSFADSLGHQPSAINVLSSLACFAPTINTSVVSNSLPEASPKKKPRKQHIITTEDKYGSAPLNSACGTDEDEEFLKSNETMKDITPPKLSPAVQQAPTTATSSVAKQLYPMSPLFNSFMKSQAASNEAKAESKCEQATNTSTLNGINGLLASSIENKPADPTKYAVFRRKPQYGITHDVKINTKAAHNHFYRYSDVKVKDEKKTMAQERLLTKSSVESASGWRLHHLSSQFDDLVSLENGICDEILKCKDIIPKPSFDSPTSSYRHNNENLSEEDLQLRLMHDLIQGSIQRCRCSVEQLEEAKTAMFKILEHRPKAMDTLKKYSRPKLKAKKKSS